MKCPKKHKKICNEIYKLSNGLLCPFVKHNPNKVLQFKCVFKEVVEYEA